MVKPVVIVGASHGGVQMAASLREFGFDGEIKLIHSENVLPYHRPPLSKAFLSDETDIEKMALRGADFYSNQSIELITDAWASSIDVAASQLSVELPANKTVNFEYEKLILATGAEARALPVEGSKLVGVHMLRDLSDANTLKQDFAEANDICVIGGGFIGLEIASTALKLGKKVTIVEAQDRLLARVFPPSISEFMAASYRDKGADLLLNTGIEAIEGSANKVEGVLLSSGEKIGADLVIVGIGAIPLYNLAETAGVKISNGINVDENCRTSVENIYAIGDNALSYNPYMGRDARIESVHNALYQAKIAAADIAGVSKPKSEAPWFWSDQLDLKLQMVGTSEGHDDTVLRGEMDSRRFSVLYFKNEKLIGVDSLNSPADHIASRKLLDDGISPAKTDCADMSVKMKSFIQR